MRLAVLIPLASWVVAFALTGLPLILAWRKRIQWNSTELALIPVPWLFWQLLEYPGVSWHPGKTWDNLAFENAILGLLPMGYALYRRYVYSGEPRRRHFYCGALIALGCAFLLHRYMPTIGMDFD